MMEQTVKQINIKTKCMVSCSLKALHAKKKAKGSAVKLDRNRIRLQIKGKQGKKEGRKESESQPIEE